MQAPTLAGAPTGRRTKWLFLLLWIGLMVVVSPLAGKLGDAENNDASSWLPHSAESTKVMNLTDEFPGAGNELAAVVYARTGPLAAADRAAAQRDRVAFARYDVRHAVPAALASKDGRALLLQVQLPTAANGDNQAVIDDVGRIRDTVVAHAPPGLRVKVTGPAAIDADTSDAFSGIDSVLLYAAAGVVALLLLLIYRSPVLWLLPLVSAAVASEVSQGVVYLLVRHAGFVVNGQTQGVLTVLVFGAATDYALLLIARYREELHRRADRHEAMAIALRRAGPAIIASSATVILGLLCLLAAHLSSNHDLGPVCAVGVGCALLVMTTLLPALLVVCGRWVFWPFRPHAGAVPRDERGVWPRIASGVGRRHRVLAGASIVLLAVLALGLIVMKNGVPADKAFRTKLDAFTGQQLLAEHYPAGQSDPAVVTTTTAAERTVLETVRETPGVASVLPVRRHGGTTQIQAVLTSDATDGTPAARTIQRLRLAVHSVPNAHALVGGTTAVTMDVRDAWSHDRRVVIPLVLLIVFSVLALILRSLVAPLVLIATVGLSFVGSLGLSTFLFQHVFGFAGVDDPVVLFGFLFLVALGVDYNIFLM
ncbi:MAG: hypothetical protein DLM56_07805, partial [Pseudonocardiales bacterium]